MGRKATGQPPGRRPRADVNASHVLAVKLTPAEADQVRARADAAGQSMSEYVRGCLFGKAASAA
jgi:hypothetical protein